MTTKSRGLPFKTLLQRRGAFLLPMVLAGAMLAVQQPARAQNVDDQLQRLQRELSDLQRQVYGGAAPPAAGAASGGSGVTTTQAARIQLQLDQFEAQLRQLTGRIEDMNFQVQNVSSRLDKLVADVDLRLRNLEQGGLPPMSGAETSGGQFAGQPMADAQAGSTPSVAPPSSATPGTLGSISETDLNTFQRQQAAAAAAQGAQASSGGQTAAAPPAAAVLPGSTPQEQYDYAFGLLRQANYAGAQEAFAAFLQQNPAHGLSGNAKYWLGETYYVRGNYQQAAVTFAEGFEAYPDNSKAPDNLLKLGMSLASLGSTQDACGTFDVLLSRYGDAPATILSRAQRESQRLGCP
ncbi:MAG: tol-pal system protein YbgF [Kiloniellaceae bacterium]